MVEQCRCRRGIPSALKLKIGRLDNFQASRPPFGTCKTWDTLYILRFQDLPCTYQFDTLCSQLHLRRFRCCQRSQAYTGTAFARQLLLQLLGPPQLIQEGTGTCRHSSSLDHCCWSTHTGWHWWSQPAEWCCQKGRANTDHRLWPSCTHQDHIACRRCCQRLCLAYTRNWSRPEPCWGRTHTHTAAQTLHQDQWWWCLGGTSCSWRSQRSPHTGQGHMHHTLRLTHASSNLQGRCMPCCCLAPNSPCLTHKRTGSRWTPLCCWWCGLPGMPSILVSS